MEKKYGELTNVTRDDLQLLKENPKEFWKDVTKIGNDAFACSDLSSFTVFEIPEGITELGSSAFQDSIINAIKLPNSLKHIRHDCFSGCSKLKEIEIPDSVEKIEEYCFSFCESLEKVKLPQNIKFISLDENLFSNSAIKEIIVPDSVLSINKNVFDGCIHLKKIVLSKNLKSIQSNSMKNLPNLEDFCFYLNEHNLNKTFTLYRNKKMKFLTFYKQNKKANSYQEIKLPTEFFSSYENYFNLNTNIINNLDFTYFNKIFPFSESLYTSFSIDEVQGFFDLAVSMGCFSNKQISFTDDKGNIQKVMLNEKACDTLKTLYNNLLKNNPNRGDLLNCFKNTSESAPVYLVDSKYYNPSFSFFNYISSKSNQYSNFLTFAKIFNQYKKNKELPVIITNFDEIIEQKKQTNDNWENVFYKKLNPINKTNKDVHNVYEQITKRKLPFTQEEYEKILSYVDLQNNLKTTRYKTEPEVKSHILGKPLSSKNRIEVLKKQTEKELSVAKQNLDYTYEFLDKKDLMNAYIGKYYTDCCCYLDSGFYGEDITQLVMLNNNYQNMVVRNKENKIIAKGSCYLNKEDGTLLINEFDVSNEYKSSNKANERIKILKTFIEGVNDFVDVYNSDNNKTVKIHQVNVGAGNNKLQDELCSENYTLYKKNSLRFIKPPECFEDADVEQYVLYKEPKQSKKATEIKKSTKIEKSKNIAQSKS